MNRNSRCLAYVKPYMDNNENVVVRKPVELTIDEFYAKYAQEIAEYESMQHESDYFDSCINSCELAAMAFDSNPTFENALDLFGCIDDAKEAAKDRRKSGSYYGAGCYVSRDYILSIFSASTRAVYESMERQIWHHWEYDYAQHKWVFSVVDLLPCVA